MYIAKKPCRFCGHKFIIGQEIPDDFVDASRAESLLKMGLIEFLPVIAANTPNKPLEDGGQGNPGVGNDPPENAPQTQKNGQAENAQETQANEPAKTAAKKAGTAKKTNGKKGTQK